MPWAPCSMCRCCRPFASAMPMTTPFPTWGITARVPMRSSYFSIWTYGDWEAGMINPPDSIDHEKPLVLPFVSGALPNLFAQEGTKRADRYFERAFYPEAIALYEQLLPRHRGPVA